MRKPRFRSARCVLRQDERFLLVVHRGARARAYKWGLPGGRVEEREDPESTVRRELREELGIDDVGRLRAVGEYRASGRFHKVLGGDFRGAILTFDRSEILRIGWHTLAEVAALARDRCLHGGFEHAAIRVYAALPPPVEPAAGALRLERLERRHEGALRAMAAEFRAEGDERFELLFADGGAFFAEADRFAAGRDLPEDRVPQTQFLLFAGSRLLGGARLRHRLIPVLEQDGGNVGYEIRPSERGNGYATALLALILDEARRLGLPRVLLTAALTNRASIRVIEKNGGVQDGTSLSPRTGEVMLRFWIRL